MSCSSNNQPVQTRLFSGLLTNVSGHPGASEGAHDAAVFFQSSQPTHRSTPTQFLNKYPNQAGLGATPRHKVITDHY